MRDSGIIAGILFSRLIFVKVYCKSSQRSFGEPYRTDNGILDIHWYFDYDQDNSYETYHGYSFSLNTYKVDFSGGSIWDGVIVYDALGGAKQALHYFNHMLL